MANNGDDGAVIELDPETKSVISTIGMQVININNMQKAPTVF